MPFNLLCIDQSPLLCIKLLLCHSLSLRNLLHLSTRSPAFANKILLDSNATSPFQKAASAATPLSQWRTHVEPALPNGWNLDVCYWDTMPSGGKPHARFLLTEAGGIYFDHGLDEGPGETLVTLLEDEVWEGLFRTFDA